MHYSAVPPLCHRSVMVRPAAARNLLQRFFVDVMRKHRNCAAHKRRGRVRFSSRSNISLVIRRRHCRAGWPKA